MSDDEAAAIVAAKAKELYGAPHCQHANTTLVQHTHKEFGWFACYQCDDCGTITRQAVTADDLDAAGNVPFLDVPMYMQATKEEMPNEKLERALAFLGKAAE